MTSSAAEARRDTAAARLEAVRGELKRRRLDGFLAPRSDEHNGECVAPYAERLSWLTGFDGSAGIAVVLEKKAAIFVDARYTLQAADQVDASRYEIRRVPEEPVDIWLENNLSEGMRLGFDPRLHTEKSHAHLRQACRTAKAVLETTDPNPIDSVWTDQPEPPSGPLTVHDIAFAGEESAEKRARLAAGLESDGVSAAVLTAPDSIAWLLNVRGSDTPNTPVSLSYALLRADAGVDLFIDPRKIDDDARAHLGGGVTLRAVDELPAALGDLRGQTVLADPDTASAWVFRLLKDAGAAVVRDPDPCQLAKARKNAVELDGARAAHRRDGASLTRFLRWFARHAPDGGVDELTAASKLRSFREGNEHFRGLSFETISGAGPNGAVMHYRATERTNRRIEPGMLYLVDSGAQYLDGTTDVTRTVAVGRPTDEMRDRFTRVLKGHIAVARLRFPKGVTGSQIDVLARQPLWRAGLDYDHGTGHGVGSYLGVHEGPQRISQPASAVALEPGMILSNEPGYYKPGEYGIRVESLVAVVERGRPAGGEKTMLGFDTLTRAPIDRSLVDVSLLDADEIDWLDSYHRTVIEDLDGLVDSETADWLQEAASPLGR